jgi:GWxTD domain-containing protein
MNMRSELMRNLIETPVANALGWALLHSLWQGAAIAMGLLGALSIVRSARGRYAAAWLALLAVFAAFIGTFVWVMPQAGVGAALAGGAIQLAPASGYNGFGKIIAKIRPSDMLPWLAPFWIAGVALFHMRSLVSWIAAGRLRKRGVCRAADIWQERLVGLQKRLRLSKSVALLETALAEVPVVVGYIKPTILLPLGMLAGMPPVQIEAILMHELAHIRRRDYLANLLQTLLEGFLFYHPAVWWISRVIRAERENCCDDLVVSATGNAPEYAAALTALEYNRRTANEAALAATGGNLMKRIRRMLYPQENPRAALTPILAAAVLTITAAVALMAWQTPQPATENRWDVWLNMDVAYIITDAERFAFLRLQTDDEREKFAEQFWERRNPIPNSAENPYRTEHYRRLAYVNARFGSESQVPGWKTDRGRIYIRFGPPDELDSHPSPATGTPFEVWQYRFIEGIGNNVKIEFNDTARNGEYHMTPDPNPGTPVRRP